MLDADSHPPQSRRSKWLPWLAVIGWCGFIFATSSTVILPHDFFAWIAAHLLTDKASFRRFATFWGVSWFAIVKGWHVTEYVILVTLAHMLLSRLAPSAARRNLILATLFGLLFALSDEYHQTFVPGRGGTGRDVAIDCVGVGLAAWGRRRIQGIPRDESPPGEPGFFLRIWRSVRQGRLFGGGETAPLVGPQSLADRVRAMVAEKCGMGLSQIYPTSRLEEDFGMTGDDSACFLEAFAKEFGVDMSDLEFHKHFGPENSSLLWNSHPPAWLEDHGKYPVTVDHLVRVAEIGRWYSPPRIAP